MTVPGAIGNAASTGTLQFNSSGQLVSPSTNIGGISFTGLAATGAAIGTPAGLVDSVRLEPALRRRLPLLRATPSPVTLDLQVQNNTTLTHPTATTPTAIAGSTATFTLSSSSDTLSGTRLHESGRHRSHGTLPTVAIVCRRP